MAPTATAVPPKTRMNVPTSSASAAGRMGSLVLLPYRPSPLSSSSLSTTLSLAARRMSSLVMRCPATPSARPGPAAGMSGPRPRARRRSSSWSPPARCTSTASWPLPDALALPVSTGLPSSPALPLPISLLPPFREPTVPLVDDLLVLSAPLVGTLLVATVLLALLGAHRLLGGFHRLANGLPGEHPPGLLPSAPLGVVLYIHLFAPHVLLDDLPLVDDVLADADLLFHHWLFLDHDLVL